MSRPTLKDVELKIFTFTTIKPTRTRFQNFVLKLKSGVIFLQSSSKLTKINCPNTSIHEGLKDKGETVRIKIFTFKAKFLAFTFLPHLF